MPPVIRPNLGLYFDLSPLAIPEGALQAGRNFRIREGRLSNLNLGWSRFGTIQLDGPVTLIDRFIDRFGATKIVLGTPSDLFEFVDEDNVSLLTPRYDTGTVDVSGADPAVVTLSAGDFSANGVEAGDLIHFGNANQRDHSVTWYEIDSVDSATQLTLTGAVSGAPLTGENYTVRLLFTGTLLTPWDTTTFLHAGGADEDLWFAVNGLEPIAKWDGTADEVELLSSTVTGATITVYKNMLVVGNLLTTAGDARPSSIANSDVGDPEDFTNGLASQLIVHDGSDEILSLRILGDSLVAYSNRHVTVLDFVDDPIVWNIRQAVTGQGPISGRLIAEFADWHEFIGNDGKYLFDGSVTTPIGNHAWREILRSKDPERAHAGYVHFEEEQSEAIWVVPLQSDDATGISGGIDPPDTAYTEHYLENPDNRDEVPVGTRDFPFTATGYTERTTGLTWQDITDQWQDLSIRWNDQFFGATFPLDLAGDEDGKLYTFNTAQTANGTLMPSFVRFGRQSTAGGRVRALVRRVYPFTTQFTGRTLNVTTRLADHGSGPISTEQEDTLDLTLNEGEHFVTPYRRGRFVEFEFGTDGDPYELAGYDVDLRPGGSR